MGIKKARDYRFTFEDAEGALRVVYLQAQQLVEDGVDRIVVQLTSDGVPIETRVFTDDVAHRRVKTQTELGG